MEKKKRERRKNQDPSRKNQDPISESADGTKSPNFFVVGIGASAGGLQPLRLLFSRMRSDSGMAFVVILHLSPQFKSTLAELLQKETSMAVSHVEGAVRLEPNHVYVISPNQNLMLEDGLIQAVEASSTPGARVPVDLFFRSLGDAYRKNSIAVVLSGAGADGTLGMRRIKETGGITVAQDPREAEQEGMPRSAIQAGVVDFVLPVAEIPEKLISLRENAEKIILPVADVPAPRGKGVDPLREVLALVRNRSGHDFGSYKRSTVLRRIERRLQVKEVKDIPTYLEFIREHPEEIQALLHDLLISVTNFFRDAEAFGVLEHDVIPRLFDGKKASDQVRVWVTGCATGEEAYSVAILMSEYAARLADPPLLQVFATDIDEDAIARARNGVYPDTIAADVSAERLKRFFTKDGGHYRVRKEVRELALFAPHNVLRDPPFSRLDLITCRNLLIYLTREIQERVLEIFHFALWQRGFLFLGSSESAEGVISLFSAFDKKHRVYRRSDSMTSRSFPTPPMPGRWEARSQQLPTGAGVKPLSMSDLHNALLLERHTPASILVNEENEIVHLSGQAGRFLRFLDGEPSRNLLKVAHPLLRLELRAALFGARQQGKASVARSVSVELEGEARIIKVTVEPVKEPESAQGLLMVVFEEASDTAPATHETAVSRQEAQEGAMEPVVRQIEDDLQRTRDQLRATIEQYETSLEELKASNEELQAINEELRSATEELETSKEELQSVNEELTTVNNELKEKVEEVDRTNSDLQNLMASTEIGTIFLDRALQIKRYTPRVQELFNVIPTDINRRLDHLTHKLHYANLVEDADEVLVTLKVIEREVESTDDRWYIARLLPYRTLEDRIDGVVLTFVDITDRKRLDQDRERLVEELDKQRSLLDAVIRLMEWGVIIAEAPSGRLMFGNEQVRNLSRSGFIAAPDIAGYHYLEGFHADGQPYQPEEWPLARAVRSNETIVGEEIEFRRADDGPGWLSVNAAPVHDATGNRIAAVMTFNDITERRQSVAELESARADLETRVEQRTAELNIANIALHDEINQRERGESQRKRLMRKLVTALEDERRRLSRELHDQLGQQLTALKLNLEGLTEQTKDKALKEMIEQAQNLVRTIDRDVDFLAWEFRPAALDGLGLPGALRNFVEEWGNRFKAKARFHASGIDGQRLTSESETMLYRIAQEALNNVAKHSQADRVSVVLERRDHEVVLIVEDNGIGFDLESTLERTGAGRHGLGLIGMRERAAFVGGTLELETKPGAGATVYARVPFVAAEKEK